MAIQQKKQIIGELLVEKGLISQEELERVLSEQSRTGELLGSIIIRQGLLSKEELLPVLAEQIGMPYVCLSQMQVEPEALSKVPPKFASRYRLIPLTFANGILRVAIADPFDVQTIDELKLLLGCEVRPVLASQREIHEAIQRHYGV